MVLKKKFEDLRKRPPHERESAAAVIAIGLVLILFLGWGVMFFQKLRASGFGPGPVYQTSAGTAVVEDE